MGSLRAANASGQQTSGGRRRVCAVKLAGRRKNRLHACGGVSIVDTEEHTDLAQLVALHDVRNLWEVNFIVAVQEARMRQMIGRANPTANVAGKPLEAQVAWLERLYIADLDWSPHRLLFGW